jgi:predicted RNA-binding Zn-ribbon protein involved in translation (DUF1610 family)
VNSPNHNDNRLHAAEPLDAPSGAESAGSAAGASNTGRQFPCPGCGAKLDFDPSQRALKCPYCGHAAAIATTDARVEERDWEAHFREAAEPETTIAGRSSEVQCRACAAVVLLEDKVVTQRCPYCGNDLKNEPVTARSMIPPEGILPFRVDQKQATRAFRRWIAGRWFAPSDFKRLADLGRMGGIYIPFWTYDSQTFTRYTGQRGDNYQETEHYTDTETYFERDAQGNNVPRTRTVQKTRTVTKVRWTPVSGSVEHFFDDILICASRSIPDHLIAALAPWDLERLEPFRAEFLAGFQTERYTLDLKAGFDQARGVMDGHIRALCCRDIGGDHQQLHTVQTRYEEITFKHILQPVWLAPYRYREKVYRVVVNARTGEVVGTRPYSFWKIFLLVAAIIAAIAIAAGVAGLAGALKSDRRGPFKTRLAATGQLCPARNGATALTLPGERRAGAEGARRHGPRNPDLPPALGPARVLMGQA